MSLMKTLAKVAVGVALAKGAKTMMERSAGQGGGRARGGGAGDLGGLLGGLAGGGASGRGGAGLEDMLGGLLGGGGGSGRGAGGGLGGLLEQLGGASQGGGGLGGLLGGLAGAAAGGGMLGGLQDNIQRRPQSNNDSFGSVLNSQFDANPEPAIEPSQDQEAAAGLMLAAMIQAAKSDGTFDEQERDKLMGQLGEIDAAEASFVRQQMQAQVDADSIVQATPAGMGPQIYAVSLLAIDLDTQHEAQHLHQLAQGYGMSPAEVNNIHAQMGVPSLYT